MSVQAEEVRLLVLSSKEILFASRVDRLNHAISCCLIAKSTDDDSKRLQYLLIAEETSAKFTKLRSQGKIGESKKILGLMSLLEKGLGGRLYVPDHLFQIR